MDIRRQQGFTLIELCVVLVIVSIMTSMYLGMSSKSALHEQYRTTREQLRTVASSLELFLYQNNRLPCPAPLDAEVGSARYAREGACAELSPKASHSFDNGRYQGLIIAYGRDNKLVVIGTLPTRALNVPDTLFTDAWDTPLTYAVTLDLTRPETYSQRGGAIFIADGNGNPVITPDGSAQYVLVSHGKDRDQLADPQRCQQGEREDANCSGQAHFTASDLQFASGRTYYDDLLEYAVYVSPPETAAHACNIMDVFPLMEQADQGLFLKSAFHSMPIFLQPPDRMIVANAQIVTTCADNIGGNHCKYFVCSEGRFLAAFYSGE
jgi:prepilin-type N-terminal cleavage/methylation domain-containing protein